MMGVKDAYTDWSSSYDEDRNLTRDLDEQVTRKVLKKFRCRSIIEIGCGTGKNTSFLVQIGKKVYAVDFSEGMIQKAKEKLTLKDVTFSIADVTRKWNFKSESADLIVCNLVLEHVKNIGFVFKEAYRVLTPTGCFFLCELHPFRQYQGTKANFQQDQKTIEIHAFVHHISDFIDAAETNGFTLQSFGEWWYKDDQNKPPRLASFIFVKRSYGMYF